MLWATENKKTFNSKCLKMNTSINSDIDECATQPCQNNGSCLDIVNGYRCFCTNGFTGKNCANDTCKYEYIQINIYM